MIYSERCLRFPDANKSLLRIKKVWSHLLLKKKSQLSFCKKDLVDWSTATHSARENTKEAPWIYNPTVRWKHCPGFRSPLIQKENCPVLSNQTLHGGSFISMDGFEGKWARNSFETKEGQSFDFFGGAGISQEASVFSTVFDDKNPFGAYNLMKIHTWTSRKGLWKTDHSIYRLAHLQNL